MPKGLLKIMLMGSIGLFLGAAIAGYVFSMSDVSRLIGSFRSNARAFRAAKRSGGVRITVWTEKRSQNEALTKNSSPPSQVTFPTSPWVIAPPAVGI